MLASEKGGGGLFTAASVAWSENFSICVCDTEASHACRAASAQHRLTILLGGQYMGGGGEAKYALNKSYNSHFRTSLVQFGDW